MTDSKMREAFEKWATNNEYSLKVWDSFHEEYYHGVTNTAWQAWQAAQAAPVVGGGDT